MPHPLKILGDLELGINSNLRNFNKLDTAIDENFTNIPIVLPNSMKYSLTNPPKVQSGISIRAKGCTS